MNILKATEAELREAIPLETIQAVKVAMEKQLLKLLGVIDPMEGYMATKMESLALQLKLDDDTKTAECNYRLQKAIATTSHVVEEVELEFQIKRLEAYSKL